MKNFNENDVILKYYRIEKSIGLGTFGEVYLATHTELNGKRAIKVLQHDESGIGSSDYNDYRNRFRQESQLMEWFDNPYLIRVYDFQEEKKILYLIMEYAPGGNLKQRMEQAAENGTAFSVEETVKIAIDVAEGLAALHGKDIIHRDLKPSNILFDAQGKAKVADLGLAQVPGGASMRSQLSVAKTHPGTPAYMSPEQETTGAYLRPASDIYTLGLLIFEMLTGRNYKSLEPGTRLMSLNPTVPVWLNDLVGRMLSEKAGDRPWNGYRAMQELRSGLRSSENTSPATPQVIKKSSNRKKSLLFAAAGFIIISGFCLWAEGKILNSIKIDTGSHPTTTAREIQINKALNEATIAAIKTEGVAEYVANAPTLSPYSAIASGEIIFPTGTPTKEATPKPTLNFSRVELISTYDLTGKIFSLVFRMLDIGDYPEIVALIDGKEYPCLVKYKDHPERIFCDVPQLKDKQLVRVKLVLKESQKEIYKNDRLTIMYLIPSPTPLCEWRGRGC